MAAFTQSSQFALALSDAMHLLRYAPFRVRMQDGHAALHYCAPHGIWQGAPVFYSLVQGLRVLHWQATVLNPGSKGFVVRAAVSPLGSFSATHSFEAIEGETLVRDELSCDNPAYAALFANAQVVYGFSQRREMARMQAEAPTRALPRLDTGFAAG